MWLIQRLTEGSEDVEFTFQVQLRTAAELADKIGSKNLSS